MQLYARSQNDEDFPSAEMFKSFHRKKMLAKPEEVAFDIVSILENNWDGSFIELFGLPKSDF